MENLHIASELTDDDSEEAQEGRNGGTQVGGLNNCSQHSHRSAAGRQTHALSRSTALCGTSRGASGSGATTTGKNSGGRKER